MEAQAQTIVQTEGESLQTQKKTARTFYCSCREASDANYFQFRRDQEGSLYHRNIYKIL
jgi:hypothetical protein